MPADQWPAARRPRSCGRSTTPGNSTAVNAENRMFEVSAGLTDQPPAIDERAVEVPTTSFARSGGEIHQHVAAEDHVHRIGVVRERWIDVFGQVEVGKCHHASDLRRDLEAPALSRREIPLPEPGRGTAERPFAVDALGRLAQESRVDVRGQDGDVPVRVRSGSAGRGAWRWNRVPRPCSSPRSRCADAVRPPAGRAAVPARFALRGPQALFLAEEIGFPHGQVAGQDFDLIPGQ